MHLCNAVFLARRLQQHRKIGQQVHLCYFLGHVHFCAAVQIVRLGRAPYCPQPWGWVGGGLGGKSSNEPTGSGIPLKISQSKMAAQTHIVIPNRCSVPIPSSQSAGNQTTLANFPGNPADACTSMTIDCSKAIPDAHISGDFPRLIRKTGLAVPSSLLCRISWLSVPHLERTVLLWKPHCKEWHTR